MSLKTGKLRMMFKNEPKIVCPGIEALMGAINISTVGVGQVAVSKGYKSWHLVENKNYAILLA